MNEETPKSILDRVAKLITLAEHTNTSEAEREAALAKADAMMTKYAIDRAVIESRKTSGQKKEEPISIEIPFVRDDVDFFGDYLLMLGAIARHNRCRVVTHYWKEKATLVGFPEDVEYTQMIWNSAYLAFVSKLDPSWDPSRPADENIKILKEAGWKWARIAEFANKNDFECTATDGRLKAAYRRQCKAEGVEPTAHTQRHAAYRASYAQSFSGRISYRLRQMRDAATDQVRRSGPGTELALRSRKDDVNEFLYRMFPHLRPMSEVELKELLEKRAKEEEELLAAMTPAQQAAYKRKQEREDLRNRARWEREHAKLQDRAGSRAGDSAARTVDLGARKVGGNRTKEIE